MDNNIKYIQNLIQLCRTIQDDIKKNIIKEGTPFIILKNYEWLREVLSLLAKQANLFESCILLLESNMEQEAYILARSQFNNMLWISYICNGNRKKRVKEYYYENHIMQLRNLRYTKSYLKRNPIAVDKSDVNINNIDIAINAIETILKDEGYETKNIQNKRIINLVGKDPLLLGLYNTFYNDSSKYEHADISTVQTVRNQILDDVSTDITFTFNLSTSDIKLWKTVFGNILTILYISIEKILYLIINKESHLLGNTFEDKDFTRIILNIKIALDIIDKISES